MTPSEIRQRLDSVLPFVVKPQRYLGGEINSVRKEHSSVEATIALIYPDMYEIGASNNGLSILYHVVNSDKRFCAERAYMPDADMRKQLETAAIPLYSLESFTPLTEFNAVGFTLQYELNHTNIPVILDLAGITVLRKKRAETEPLIIMGGPLSCNPLPVSEIADAVVVGDGEETIIAIMAILATDRTKQEKLKLLSYIEGVFVPEYPSVNFKMARIPELKPENYPAKPLVPLIETVHLRSAIEVMRGCSRGCRFCAAGYHYRPVRERQAEDVVSQISCSMAGEGWRDISLLSLSTADYSGLANVLDSCYSEARESHAQISLPSTRIDKATENLFSRMDLSRRSGITFAPEAGSERLRAVINKGLTEPDIIDNLRIALRAGYQVVKLYFMLGLPTETDEDVDEMASLIMKAEKVLREFKGRRFLHVSVSPFSPKPGTPFEREELISEQLWNIRIRRLRDALRNSRAELTWGDAFTAMLETVFARGGA
ncbi:MAG: TIGR03960 family B12-binding radical SAM protein, partial [Fibrobacteres bacterium]|nr:TIGR03960 family B12-binding radical SAM protein [Fibrobacterota bacterium]